MSDKNYKLAEKILLHILTKNQKFSEIDFCEDDKKEFKSIHEYLLYVSSLLDIEEEAYIRFSKEGVEKDLYYSRYYNLYLDQLRIYHVVDSFEQYDIQEMILNEFIERHGALSFM